MRGKLIFLVVLLSSLFYVLPVLGKIPGKLPNELESWREWVLYGKDKHFCPSAYDNASDFQCVWPDVLTLDLKSNSGFFKQKWTVLAETWIPLPGNHFYWPQKVIVNGQAKAVVLHDRVPAIKVEPGTYLVTGEYVWGKIPQTFPIPKMTGFLELWINKEKKNKPYVDDHGNIWIDKQPGPGESETDKEVKNITKVRIFRLVEDTVPLKIHNLIRLTVSGEKRRIKLGSILLDDNLALSVTSPIPVKLTENNDLWVEVKPGQWDVTILTVMNRQVSTIGPVKALFGNEIWSFKPYPHLRLAAVEGLAPVDPSQTTMPKKWHGYSSFLLKKGDRFHLVETQRGSSSSLSDTLSLKREIWLDFNGKGATVQDHIVGNLGKRRFFGINGEEYSLGRLIQNQKDQLVTVYKKNRLGIELEKGPVDLVSVSRIQDIESGKSFSIGWEGKFQSAKALLHLPPGWHLFGLRGGHVPSGATWVDRWSLLDFFLILMISIAIANLKSRRWGILFFMGLILTWQELYAPQYVWIILVLTTAILKVFHEKNQDDKNLFYQQAFQWIHVFTLLVLAGITVLFVFTQLRSAAYPQLEPHLTSHSWEAGGQMDDIQRSVPSAKRKIVSRLAKKQRLSLEQEVYDELKSPKQYLLIPEENMVTQTGPGIPKWRWKSVGIEYGLISGKETMALWFFSPQVNSVLSIIRVAFLLVLVLCFISSRLIRSITEKKLLSRTSIPICLGCLLFMHTGAEAAFPSPELLLELENRLLEKSDCFPTCASISSMEISIPQKDKVKDRGLFVDIRFEVNAVVETAIPLPTGNATWSPYNILLNNKPYVSMLRKNRSMWMRVPQGFHVVNLKGVAQDSNQLRFGFPLNPSYVHVTAPGWEVKGLDTHNQVVNTLLLTRITQQEETDESFFSNTRNRLSGFLRVKRTLLMGLEWTVTTTVERIVQSEDQQAITVSIPLLKNEMIRTEGFDATNGNINLELPAEKNQISWHSSIPPSATIRLAVLKTADWAEVWHVEASPLWHYTQEGLPATYNENVSGTFWYPWPGEKLLLQFTKLETAPGESLTIDSIKTDYHIGEGYNKIIFQAKLRTSRGGQHEIVPPANTVLKKVRINQKEYPISGNSKTLQVPLQPGIQTLFIEWHQPVAWQTNLFSSMFRPIKISLPKIDMTRDASNIDLFFHLPYKVWLIFAGGPRLGPAILIWSYVAVIFLAAILLGRYSRSPLRTYQWMLLGIGLVPLDPMTIVLVSAWFLAIEMRGRYVSKSPLVFNVTQICLVLWSGFVVLSFYRAIQNGLLGIPDMQVAGNGSNNWTLHWTMDRSEGILPQPWIIALSMYAYRLAMFLWALWLAFNVVGWSKWAFQAFREQGVWKKREKKKTVKPKRSALS